jgi:ABC-type transport system substrate-binding protein
MKQHRLIGQLLCAASALLQAGCSTHQSDPVAIRIRWAHDPETLDPLQSTNQLSLEAVSLLHLSLLQVDFAQQQPQPTLAEALPTVQLVGDSLTRLHYRIRPAAAWDNGRPVLASDVAFTLKLMFCPGLPNEDARARYSFIKDFEPDKANPRHFTLVCQGQSLEYAQASGEFYILPEAALDPRSQLRRFSLAELQNRSATPPPDSALQAVARRYLAAAPGNFPEHLPGCGPYQLAKWNKDQYLSFRRKPHWWANRLRPTPLVLQALPPQLDYVIIPDAATATLALRRGDLDVFPQMPTREFTRLQNSLAARADLNFYSTTSYDVMMAGFNTRHAILADALTRQALSHCFDAAGLQQATQLGGGQRTASIISPTNRNNYNDSLPPVAFDTSATVALLHQAGWQRANGAESGWFRTSRSGQRQLLRLVLRYRANEAMYATVALQFQAATAALDIPVVLRPTESGGFSTALRTGDFDVYIRVLKGNPFMFNFIPLLHSAGIGEGNSTGFSTPASDRLIEAIAAANSQALRKRLLRRFQVVMLQEMPMVPLFVLPNRIAASRQITGLHVSSLKPGYSVTTLVRTPTPSSNP